MARYVCVAECMWITLHTTRSFHSFEYCPSLLGSSPEAVLRVVVIFEWRQQDNELAGFTYINISIQIHLIPGDKRQDEWFNFMYMICFYSELVCMTWPCHAYISDRALNSHIKAFCLSRYRQWQTAIVRFSFSPQFFFLITPDPHVLCCHQSPKYHSQPCSSTTCARWTRGVAIP